MANLTSCDSVIAPDSKRQIGQEGPSPVHLTPRPAVKVPNEA